MQKKNRFYANRPQSTQRQYMPNFARYEQEKREWIDAHPESTPEQYQEAIRVIAARCGV